jgi:carbamoyltransferase
MTVCLRARPALQRSCPAAVHVDGTARPQLLCRQQQPALHALLGRLEAMGLPPVLLNTSFNQHEEPIVCSSSDAVKAWRSSGVEALWMGPYVAEQG